MPQKLTAILYKYKKLWFLFPVLFTLFVYRVWFFSTAILTSADWNLQLPEALNQYLSFPYIWLTDSFGSINITSSFYPFNIYFGVLHKLHLPYGILERLVFLFPIVIVSSVGIYLLLKRFYSSRAAILVGFFVFIFNIYFFQLQTAHLTVMMAFAFFPLLIFYFLKLLEEDNKYLNLFLLTLYSFIASFYEFRSFYIMFIILIFYYLYSILRDIRNLKTLHYFIFYAILILLLNIYWLIGLESVGAISSNSAFNRGLFGNQFLNTLYAFNLYHPFWTGTEVVNFTIQPIPLFYWIVPIVAFSGLVLSIRRKNIVFFAFVALLGILLTKQVAYPFPNLYQWLYDHFPGFNAFREASKFFSLIAISYSILIAASIDWIWTHWNHTTIQKIAKYTIVGTILAVFIWNTKPLITGEIKTLFVPRYMPQEYITFENFISKQSSSFRTIWVPRDSRWGVYNNLHPKISAVDSIQSSWFNFLSNTPGLNFLTQQNMIVSILKQQYSSQLFNNSAIKYVVVPLQDKANDDDFFESYGGKENPNIRQWYIDQLDQISWLHRVDIGTKDLVVYENPSYQQPIHAFTRLFALDSATDIDKKFSFFSTALKGDFYFTSRDKAATTTDFSKAITISQPFGNISADALLTSAHTIVASSSGSTTSTSLYSNPSARDIFAKYDGGVVTFYRDNADSLALNGVSFVSAQALELESVKVTTQKDLYISAHGTLFPLKSGGAVKLGAVPDGEAIELYATGENIVQNGSFEEGLWGAQVGDCNHSDDNGLIAMSLNTQESTKGFQSLQLEATRHVACTAQQLSVRGGMYLLSFDFKGVNAGRASYYLGVNNPSHTIVSGAVPITVPTWQTLQKAVSLPASSATSSASLYLYAQSSDGVTNVVNRYDNVRFQPLELVDHVVVTPRGAESLSSVAKVPEYRWSYTNPNYSLENHIANPSLEDGLWQSQVGDCNNYDENGAISMRADTSDSSHGSTSLELAATRHIACTGTSAKVSGGGTYLLSFDYKTAPQTHEASYYIGFDSTTTDALSETLPTKTSAWQHFSRTLHVPGSASAMSLSVYARESDGKTNNVVHYDNFKLIEIPDIANEYYVVSDPGLNLVEPKSVTFDLLSPTKKVVHVKGATTGFYLAFSESYHPQWKLELQNEKVQGRWASWWPKAKPDFVADSAHYQLDDFLNAWYIDPELLCNSKDESKKIKGGCTQNADGSYDLEMVIEFWPQRWFYFGLIISGTTLAGCLGYLGIASIRALRKRRKLKITSLKSPSKNLDEFEL